MLVCIFNRVADWGGVVAPSSGGYGYYGEYSGDDWLMIVLH